jgi:acetyl-CoA synthetase
VFIHNTARFTATALLETLVRCGVTSLCAPPTVWRMLIQEDLAAYRGRLKLREVTGAGEPLNPEIIERVRDAWGLALRDGYGQTETTAQIGNAPGQRLRPGSMGRPLPGYEVVLLDADGQPADEGEICLKIDPRPVGLMAGYEDSPGKTADVMRGGYYHTGDVAIRDADGYLTFVGRADDVFKASDYRISPFELESALLEHPAVTEVAVVPSPDSLRLAVPKAFITLTAGTQADAALARDVLAFVRKRLSPFQRVRRIEFVAELPKTVSGKIRRVELRQIEADRRKRGVRDPGEHFEEDFPDLKSSS